jgi:competence protein ComEC
MSELNVTLIDVGWGDSILIEFKNQGEPKYGLIDSNDDDKYQPSIIYLKKFFKIPVAQLSQRMPVFDFIVLSHDHSDHGTGLKPIMRYFGTKYFWYPKVPKRDNSILAPLQDFANSKKGKKCVGSHRAIDSDIDLSNCLALGDVALDVLWPPRDTIDKSEPNNNSLVLTLTLEKVTFVLGGDAELDVWENVASQIPASTKVFKVPHHGSKNGTILHGKAPWLNKVNQKTHLGISCHPTYPRGFSNPHPHKKVIQEFDKRKFKYYRTDLNYHLTFSTKGNGVRVKYSR